MKGKEGVGAAPLDLQGKVSEAKKTGGGFPLPAANRI
jgi:hypothetical protein